ncbi:hypothetical protein QZH41_009417 [Actinostola sp. cb2023]|nr:hypothetical protein QZH41_009417 [Actinostola sp. cb2023]
MKDLYRKKIQIGNDPAHTEQEMTRLFFPKGQKARKTSVLIYEFTYNLSSIRTNEEKISHAELRLHRKRTKAKGRLVRLCSLALFTKQPVWKRRTNISRNMAPTFVQIKVVPLSGKSLWIRFNVSAVLKEQVEKRLHKMIQFKVYVQAYGTSLPPKAWINRHGKNKPSLVVYSRLEKENGKPLNLDLTLVANSMMTSVKRRAKRGDLNQYCQRRRMYVKFRSIHLQNLVIAPVGFSAYICEGSCPIRLTSSFNPTNHAILQNLLNSRFSKLVPQVSCVPIKLHSLTILYREVGDSYALREFPEMIVSSCGCR